MTPHTLRIALTMLVHLTLGPNLILIAILTCLLTCIVLYHLSSGWICHAPGQDPSHSDDDITQYMQQGLLQPMVYSSKEILPSICPFASIRIVSVQIGSIRAD